MNPAHVFASNGQSAARNEKHRFLTRTLFYAHTAGGFWSVLMLSVLAGPEAGAGLTQTS